ncbi:MAG: 3-dehydroquinate dehydratase [Cyanobacteria bacterium NC_groundwater_1444_Ag_S-0.65um_54_12]|nr:3-dehydroquinate dehydratase [Cyanobacteria bacterium NC_groundwater_1444_Ag_S-0.65um_54_12]
MTKVIVLHGPNLNLLGRREPFLYDDVTLVDINEELRRLGREVGVDVHCRQSNHEGQLIDWIQTARSDGFHGLLINPGGLGYTSLILYEALLAADLAVVEVHLDNLYERDTDPRYSSTAKAAKGVIMGFGPDSYLLGLRALSKLL